MGLKSALNTVKTTLYRIADTFNNPVTMQAATAEDIVFTDGKYVASDKKPFTVYIGTEGDISVKMTNGGDIIFSNIPAGMFMPISIVELNETDTTATNLIAIR